MSGDKLSSGDGLGSVVGAGNQSLADQGARVGQMMATMGVPGKMRQSRFQGLMGQIYAKFNARTAEQKESVCDALTYLAIVHGCGPNVRWEEIECAPLGCKPVMMNEIVDGITTRAHHRRFMTNFSARAQQMYGASTELQLVLAPRAVRNGVPLTETHAVIDFLDSSTGVAPSTIGYRITSKYSAVKRANSQALASVDRTSNRAAEVMHAYGDDDGDSMGDI